LKEAGIVKPPAPEVEPGEHHGPCEPALPPLHTGEVVKAALLALTVVACLSAVYLTPFREFLHPANLDQIKRRIDALEAFAPASLLLLTAAGVAFGVPRVFFAALAGVVCGWFGGILIAQAGTMLGCILTFVVARRLGRRYVERRVGERFVRFERVLNQLEHHGIAGNLLIRSAPVGNCLVANLLMAVSPIPMWPFLIGTFLGTLPETVIYALLGSGARGQLFVRVVSGVILLLALSVCYWFYTRRTRLGLPPPDMRRN